jgi:hypothetical protein
MIGTFLIIFLALVMLGILPSWKHSRGWSYIPSGGVGILLVIVIILLITGRI